MKGVVTSHKGTLKSILRLPHEDRDDWRKVPIRVNMASDPAALAAILHALETANPFLFVTNLRVRAPRNLATRSRTPTTRFSSRNRGAGSMQVRYDVAGYMRLEEQ